MQSSSVSDLKEFLNAVHGREIKRNLETAGYCEGNIMSDIQVYYNSQGQVLIELDGSALELERAEAEALFLDLGYCLKDMDAREGQFEED